MSSNHSGNILHSPIFGGVILFMFAITALFWANIDHDSYHHFWHEPILDFHGVSGTDYAISLHNIINEFLMAIFFFFTGLEIKREVMYGDLSTFSKAILPIAGALGGMLFPALIFFTVNIGQETANGWGVPMATDIAFSLAILALLGSRVPVALKIFLTALAIGDDLGAIMVIAAFYTPEIEFVDLIIAAVGLGILFAMNRFGVRNKLWYYIIGIIVVWLAFLASGIHSTIAGVLVAFTIPSRQSIKHDEYVDKAHSLLDDIKNHPKKDEDIMSETIIFKLKNLSILTENASNPLQLEEKALHPIVSFFILPLFAIANAGVTIEGNVGEIIMSDVSMGILLGLILGKPIGIYLFTKLFTLLGIGDLNKDIKWSHIIGVGFLAGMGFTMSLFVTDLAFTKAEYIENAKLAIIIASFVSGIIGFFLLNFTLSKKS
jgi:NhaA family Na+:H+ antiporter